LEKASEKQPIARFFINSGRLDKLRLSSQKLKFRESLILKKLLKPDVLKVFRLKQRAARLLTQNTGAFTNAPAS
jgi:hypothetical protein